MCVARYCRSSSASVAIGARRASSAAAQEPDTEPIGRFAADVRVALPSYPDDPATATALGVTIDNLPSRGLGLAAGVNVYPLRVSESTSLSASAASG